MYICTDKDQIRNTQASLLTFLKALCHQIPHGQSTVLYHEGNKHEFTMFCS